MNDNRTQQHIEDRARHFLTRGAAGLKAWQETGDDRACGEGLSCRSALEQFVLRGFIRYFSLSEGTLRFNDGTTFEVDA